MFGSDLGPLLCNGTTEAVLRVLGNTPSVKLLFIEYVIGMTILSPQSFSIFGPIPPNPVDLFVLSLFNIFFYFMNSYWFNIKIITFEFFFVKAHFKCREMAV